MNAPQAIRPVRGLYTHADLAPIFNPRSIALVGATPNEASFAGKTLQNLGAFSGPLFLVNSRYETIGERTCYPSVSALPETPDCVVVAVRREAVREIVDDCVVKGVGGIILYAAGFAETGDAEWTAQQAALTEIARSSGIPIVGPNCLGAFNFQRNALITFVNALKSSDVRKPSIGLVSQSGALGLSLGEAQRVGTSISHIVLPGNCCDVDIADGISFLAGDPDCQAIACVFEGMSDPLRLIAAGEAARKAGKTVVACKLATGEMGAAAAVSHTGSLAGSNAAWQALFDRAGIVTVDDFEALIETATFFAKARPPLTPGVAAISASGGAAIMAADKAELHGVPMPQPTEPVRRRLQELIPAFGSTRNPFDATAQVASDPGMQEACITTLLEDPSYGTLVQVMGSSGGNSERLVNLFRRLGRESDKLTCIVWNSAWHDSPWTFDLEADPNIVLFRSMDRCFATLATWQRRGRTSGHATTTGRLTAPSVAEKAAQLIADAGDRVLTESEAKAVLALYGLPVVPERLTQSADEAVAAASEFGFPVVIKVESPDIPHKTEAGVVRLNLGDDNALRAAFDEVMANARAAVPGARIRGVLVQPMIGQGVEVMIGGRVDPQFGPLIVAGFGGVLVELLRDTSLALAPVAPLQAKAMLDDLRGRRLLDGFRGGDPVDVTALADLVVRVSEFVFDQAGLIEEIDINPLVCNADGIVAIDALITKS